MLRMLGKFTYVKLIVSLYAIACHFFDSVRRLSNLSKQFLRKLSVTIRPKYTMYTNFGNCTRHVCLIQKRHVAFVFLLFVPIAVKLQTK